MRAIVLARVLDGSLLLSAPSSLRRRAGLLDERSVVVARVLGARQLAQGAVTARWPGGRTLRIGAVIDALHAASMLLLAGLDASRRRPALLSGATAGSFAAAGLLAARRASGRVGR